MISQSLKLCASGIGLSAQDIIAYNIGLDKKPEKELNESTGLLRSFVGGRRVAIPFFKDALR
jgi:hypothetical protein